MGLLFNAKKHRQDADPRKQLTRYKQMHSRNAPLPELDAHIDLRDGLTRMEPRHVRAPLKEQPVAKVRTPKRTTSSVAADLHATDPISIDVLRRALPLRTAMIDR